MFGEELIDVFDSVWDVDEPLGFFVVAHFRFGPGFDEVHDADDALGVVLIDYLRAVGREDLEALGCTSSGDLDHAPVLTNARSASQGPQGCVAKGYNQVGGNVLDLLTQAEKLEAMVGPDVFALGQGLEWVIGPTKVFGLRCHLLFL